MRRKAKINLAKKVGVIMLAGFAVFTNKWRVSEFFSDMNERKKSRTKEVRIRNKKRIDSARNGVLNPRGEYNGTVNNVSAKEFDELIDNIDDVDINEEIKKRANWTVANFVQTTIDEMYQIHKLEAKSKILRNQYIQDNYINGPHMDKASSKYKAYCLLFVMNNLSNFPEFQDGLVADLTDWQKMSNSQFQKKVKVDYKDYVIDGKSEGNLPQYGDVVTMIRKTGGGHAVTYIGEKLREGKDDTVSGNSDDHGGGSEVKLVGMDHWNKDSYKMYFIDTKGLSEKYWKELYKEEYKDKGEEGKKEFLVLLYMARIEDKGNAHFMVEKERMDAQEKMIQRQESEKKILAYKEQKHKVDQQAKQMAVYNKQRNMKG